MLGVPTDNQNEEGRKRRRKRFQVVERVHIGAYAGTARTRGSTVHVQRINLPIGLDGVPDPRTVVTDVTNQGGGGQVRRSPSHVTL